MTLAMYAPPLVNTGRRERISDTGERIGFHRSELLENTRPMEAPVLPSGNNNRGLRRQQHIRPISHEKIQQLRHGPGYIPGWNRDTPPKQPTYTPPPAPAQVNRKTKFRKRLMGAWDWFRVSACYIAGSGVLLAGGIVMTKGLIVLFQAVLGEYLPS